VLPKIARAERMPSMQQAIEMLPASWKLHAKA